MKKILAGVLTFAALSPVAALAGSTGVSNSVSVRDVNTNRDVNVDRVTNTNAWESGSAYSFKAETITESIALPDGLGTKDIVTYIETGSESTGHADIYTSESLSLSEHTSENGFIQDISAGADYGY